MTDDQVQSFYAGEQIFGEGQRGDVAYLIRRGSVQVFAVREGKRVTIRTLGEGAWLGEMSAISGQPRSASAVAAVPSELLVIPAARVQELLNQGDTLARSLVTSLIERLRDETEVTLAKASGQHPIVATANLLAMEGQLMLAQKAATAPQGYGRAPLGAGNSVVPLDVVDVPMARASRLISDLLGMPRERVRSLFKTMAGLNLINLVPPRGEPKLQYRPSEIVKNAENISRSFGEMVDQRMQVESEYLDLDEIVQDYGVDPKKFYKKLIRADFPQEFVIFRKAEALKEFKERGPAFFEELRAKEPSQFDSIDDVEYVSIELLRAELAQMEPYHVAVLVRFIVEAETRDRMLSALSGHMRKIIEQTLESIPESEQNRSRELGLELIGRLKATLMANRKAVS